jgi:hypothetical protein
LQLVFPLVQDAVVGFDMFAATKTLALVFADASKRASFLGKGIPETSLALYPAPRQQAILRKYTLHGVPTHDPQGFALAIRESLSSFGDVVSLLPMVHQATGWRSSTWHMAMRVPTADAPHPPAQFPILDVPITCDIPGERRFCNHCKDTVHVLASCRQGQRLRNKARQLQAAQVALTASLQKGSAPAEDGSHPDPPPHPQPHQQPPPSTPRPPSHPPNTDDALLTNDTNMEYESSSSQYALSAANAAMQQQLHHAVGTGMRAGSTFDTNDVHTPIHPTTARPGGPDDPFIQ